MITINNLIQRAVFVEIIIPDSEILNDNKSGTSIQQIIKERSHYWAKKTYEGRCLTVKLFKIFFDIPVFNDGEMKTSIVITGHVYGGQTGKDVSGGDAYDVAEDFKRYIKTGTSPTINIIERKE